MNLTLTCLTWWPTTSMTSGVSGLQKEKKNIMIPLLMSSFSNTNFQQPKWIHMIVTLSLGLLNGHDKNLVFWANLTKCISLMAWQISLNCFAKQNASLWSKLPGKTLLSALGMSIKFQHTYLPRGCVLYPWRKALVTWYPYNSFKWIGNWEILEFWNLKYRTKFLQWEWLKHHLPKSIGRKEEG